MGWLMLQNAQRSFIMKLSLQLTGSLINVKCEDCNQAQ